MKLVNEDISKVLVSDLPETSEYAHILHDAQKAGKLMATDYNACIEAATFSRHNMEDLIARCIARGMRLEREKNRKVN